MQLVKEGLYNPVIASAMHQHSEDYVSIMVQLINSDGISKCSVPDLIVNDFFLDVIKETVKFIKVQILNVNALLIQEDSGSSLVDDEKRMNLSDLDDIKPSYSKNLCLFESFEPQRNEVKVMQDFVNGDIEFSKEDQIVIVIRKIYFYVEILGNFLRRNEDYETQRINMNSLYLKVEFLFEIPEFNFVIN